MDYTHSQINHSQNFVDPDNAAVHTQIIEHLWRDIKDHVKRPGIRSSYLYQYLARYLFISDTTITPKKPCPLLSERGSPLIPKTGREVEVLATLIGGDDQDKVKLRVKCKDVYNKFTGLKKHFTNPGTWQKLHKFLHDIFYQTQSNNSLQPDHSYGCQPTTSTPKQHKRKSSPVQHAFSPKKLKTDFKKCPTQREAFISTVKELKAARSLNYQMKRNVADLKRAYRKKAIDQRNRRHTDKRNCLKQKCLQSE
ncbi:hypothetical protein PoB_001186300 [Plakobranchus ocellatus]|uniref:Uncharacterized protein n=1 Tax=Plakobranchus ocellatus TaxID=259542 RepID=A0AAV3YSX2_9GAST|nr:hypothetical protein PoB_001186300 [Plakobranchus ocellatus]